MSEEVWICPWAICDQERAQACRNMMKTGCGGRFPSEMTPEQARERVESPPAPSSTQQGEGK